MKSSNNFWVRKLNNVLKHGFENEWLYLLIRVHEVSFLRVVSAQSPQLGLKVNEISSRAPSRMRTSTKLKVPSVKYGLKYEYYQ